MKVKLQSGDKLPVQYRSLQFKGAEINDEDRLVKGVSVSSDEPYERYFGTEILRHTSDAVDLSRMTGGATPLLYNHKRDDLLGKAMNPRLEGGKLRVDLKFSNSEKAKQALQDLRDGILTECSIGYVVEKFEVDEKAETYTALRWKLYECSLVTIPADASVGVGRDADLQSSVEVVGLDGKTRTNEKTSVDNSIKNENTRGNQMSTEATPAATETKIDVVKERTGAVAEFKARCKKIDDYVAGLKNPQWREAAAVIANKHKDGEADFDTFRTDALNAFDGVKAVSTSDKPDIGMSEKEVKRFSLLGAIRSMAKTGRLEGFEKEASEAAQKQMKRELVDARSFVIPEEVSRHHDEMILRHMLATRAQNVTTATAGGYTVQSQYGALIELLRNRTALGRLGITILDGLVGDFIMPVQTGGATAYWVSETGSITDSEATFGQKAMTPHRLGASIPYTMQFLAQSSLSVDAFLRNELDIVLALKRDLSGFHGTGVGGEPIGIANTTGINATVTYGGAPVWADVVQHETGITVDNADIGSMGFALNATSVGKWKTVLKDSVAGAGYLLEGGGENMSANGYPVVRTNQISSANQSFFGVFSQFIHGIWAGREITVDNITLAKSGQHQIIINELCDNLLRQPLAFNVSTDSAAQ